MKTPLFSIVFEFDHEANWPCLGPCQFPETYDERVLFLNMAKDVFDVVQNSIPEDYELKHKTRTELHAAILEERKKRLEL